jgi:hypothetical protein
MKNIINSKKDDLPPKLPIENFPERSKIGTFEVRLEVFLRFEVFQISGIRYR